MSDSTPRQLALDSQRARDRELLKFHEKVAALLSSDRRDEILAKASARVAMWKAGDLCSLFYIETWTRILDDDTLDSFRSEILAADARESKSLMQNSPFSFLMNEI